MAAEPEYVISSRVVSRIVAAAGSYGVDAAAICARVELDPAVLADIDGYVPIERYFALLREVRTRVADPSFPFVIARDWGATENLLRFVCRSCPNLGEALERASRFLRVVTNSADWPYQIGPEVTVLALVRHVSSGPTEMRFADELATAEILTRMRDFTGIELHPTRVDFAFPAPADTSAHERFFGCPLAFGQPRTEIHLPTAALSLPLVQADPSTLAFFESYLQKLLQTDDGSAPRTAIDEVRRELARGVHAGVPALPEVATALGTSGRTLRRRLQQEGTSFQRLADETRFELAKGHIKSGTLSLSTIAVLLGFSEPSAFHRAFRRWSGMTPQAYARRVRAPHAPV